MRKLTKSKEIGRLKRTSSSGPKYDDGKLRWDLVPFDAIEGLVEILTFGTKKYYDNSWKTVDNGIERYFAAMMRHLSAWRNGEENDSESGFSHLSHALTNIVFIIWLSKNGKKASKSKG